MPRLIITIHERQLATPEGAPISNTSPVNMATLIPQFIWGRSGVMGTFGNKSSEVIWYKALGPQVSWARAEHPLWAVRWPNPIMPRDCPVFPLTPLAPYMNLAILH